MGSRPYRKHDLSVLHRSPDAPHIPGDQAVRAAFDARDTNALREALQAHPGAWQTDLCRLSPGNDLRYDGPCAHFAVKMAWTAALRVLHEAGDPLTGRHPSSGLTVLQLAARKGDAAMVRALLKLGVAVDDEEAPALVGLRGQDTPLKKQMAVADVLLAAGADPWVADPASERRLPFPIVQLQWNNLDLATYLAQHGTAPRLPDDGSLMEHWKHTLKRHNSYKHICLLDALHQQGLAPRVQDLAALLPEASHSMSIYAGQGQSEAQVIAALIDRRVQLGVSRDDMRAARPYLQDADLTPATLALVEQSLLDEEVAPAASKRASMRF